MSTRELKLEWEMTDPSSNEQNQEVQKLYKPGDPFEIDGRVFVLGEAKRIEPGEDYAFEMHLPSGLKLVKVAVARLKVTMSEDDFNTIIKALEAANHLAAFENDACLDLRDGLLAAREREKGKTI